MFPVNSRVAVRLAANKLYYAATVTKIDSKSVIVCCWTWDVLEKYSDILVVLSVLIGVFECRCVACKVKYADGSISESISTRYFKQVK